MGLVKLYPGAVVNQLLHLYQISSLSLAVQGVQVKVL